MLYTVSGKKILEKKLQEGANTISAKKYSLATGVYLIKMKTKGEESITKKVIIK